MAEPHISARHLVVCREVVYDPLDAEAPYSLRGLLTALRPDDDYGYPWCLELVCLFAQLFGEPGRYVVRIELVRISEDGSDVGTAATVYGPAPVWVRVGEFVEWAWFMLTYVPFPEPGLYEFRLVLDGYDGVLASERLCLEA